MLGARCFFEPSFAAQGGRAASYNTVGRTRLCRVTAVDIHIQRLWVQPSIDWSLHWLHFFSRRVIQRPRMRRNGHALARPSKEGEFRKIFCPEPAQGRMLPSRMHHPANKPIEDPRLYANRKLAVSRGFFNFAARLAG
jgi:hypothetical protein